ncbi:hypothetical protein EB796_021552 [Bugula neritina]|uniref:Uncharacterized protein n=1 Tax=Bugula neritina TaxID=10212 RepID=A0A7J7J207_BUGNE|nr:hypothetical protein EB796_021552 [Bugula neritina]
MRPVCEQHLITIREEPLIAILIVIGFILHVYTADYVRISSLSNRPFSLTFEAKSYILTVTVTYTNSYSNTHTVTLTAVIAFTDYHHHA